MTEKQYGGNTGRSTGTVAGSQDRIKQQKIAEKIVSKEIEESSIDTDKIRDYKKAGEIAKKVKLFCSFVKKGMPLLEIADKIEAEIVKLGGQPGFPVNLSINEIAAHYTPSYDDKTLAEGLLKIDLGVHINGCISDTAISFDLENSDENKKLIKSSEDALNSALEYVKANKEKSKLNKIGKTIKETIEKDKFYPIINLSGHGLESYQIHAGITIPNCDNGNEKELGEGAFAIEPFSTTGLGQVYEGKNSGIYMLQRYANTRDSFSRKVIDFIHENYKTLPFASRWIVKEFGTRALISLSLLTKEGLLHQFPELIEKSKAKVAQAEHSFIIHNGKVEIIT